MTIVYADDQARQKAIMDAIFADHQASDREIARRTGTSHPTVAKVRKLIVEDAYEAAPNYEAWRTLCRYSAAKSIAWADARDRVALLEETLRAHGIEVPE